MVKRYDQAYFDRWYRHPRHRVSSPAALARKVSAVVSVAEYLLGRGVRYVLDVGCGEAPWYPVLRRLRPAVRYTGIDASEYVVRRFGRRRNIRPGTFGGLRDLPDVETYDLVVCCDVMQYLSTRELRQGVSALGERLGGVAFLEAYTTADDMVGDLRDWHRRSPDYYRRLFRSSGLVACGLHCYVGAELAANTTALERT